MVEVRSKNALERRMELGEQAANAIAGVIDAGCEIITEASQYGELGELFIGQLKRAQRVRYRGNGFRNDRGIASIGLG